MKKVYQAANAVSQHIIAWFNDNLMIKACFFIYNMHDQSEQFGFHARKLNSILETEKNKMQQMWLNYIL